MLNIAVCDDDIAFSGMLETMLFAISTQEHIGVDIDVFFEGSELVNSVCREKKCYDLIFLDIEMKKMNGLEAAREIRKIDDITLLIYVTSHKSYAIDAYEVQPFQFMVKPVNQELLYKYFRKAYEKIISGSFYFQYKYGRYTYRLLMNDIMYFSSNRRVIYIHMSDGEIKKYYDKLNNIEERLKYEKLDFWRIHQSYLVNVRYIACISYDEIELKNCKKLYISEDRRKLISELYCNYVGDKIIE